MLFQPILDQINEEIRPLMGQAITVDSDIPALAGALGALYLQHRLWG